MQRDVSAYLDVPLVSIYYREDIQTDFSLIGSTEDTAESIDADDDIVVALTVHEQPIELHGRSTTLHGELAFPLAIRKALVGMLVLGNVYLMRRMHPMRSNRCDFLLIT